LNTQKTAILFFSRTAKTEAKIKPLAQGKRASESVAEFAIQTIHRVAEQTDIPLFVITEIDQRGCTFGERFANAFEDVYNKGFEKVIAIGNDCLSISVQDILHAANILYTNQSVIGPSPDGGAYLIGLHKAAFQKQVFCDIAWQSAHTLSTLQDYLVQQKCDSVLLTEKADVDTISDWASVLKAFSFNIRKQLLLLFAIGKKTLANSFYIFITHLYCATTKSLRAPPHSI
jgi:glycosyltransferase A (GT-A) superfamily protein (DUF2064 family)